MKISRTSNIQHRTSNIQWMPDDRISLDVRRGMLDVGCSRRSASVPGRSNVAILAGIGFGRTSATRGLLRPGRARSGGFTMIEIALCLAIIGFALVSILLVLPSGMHTQRDVRQETIISQDATMLLEAIRGGARGLDDLTNNVIAIVNYWTAYNPDGTISQVGANTNSYNWASINIPPNSLGSDILSMHLTNGLRIIGLLSTPEFADATGAAIPSLNFGGISNHVVAYVRSFSGLAAEKPPQDNQIMQADTFTYRLICVNAPMPTDTNLFYLKPLWQSQSYNSGDQVFYRWVYWQAIVNALPTDIPGQSGKWIKVPIYPLELVRNQRELRMTFLWPQQPNGGVGSFKQTFRTSISGQLTLTNYAYLYPGIAPLYFYQPQSFTAAP